jgi:hypothetical protein
MAVEDKLIKVAIDDPRRCQGSFKNGQCQFISNPGTNFCEYHNAPARRQIAQQENRSFRLAQWQSRLNEFTDNPNVKTLREEIGIARITLENILLMCQDSNDLLIYSSKIGDMLTRIQKLVATCHAIENQLGLTLDKSAVISLAEKIITIFEQHIQDEDTMKAVAKQVGEAIVSTKKEIT